MTILETSKDNFTTERRHTLAQEMFNIAAMSQRSTEDQNTPHRTGLDDVVASEEAGGVAPPGSDETDSDTDPLSPSLSYSECLAASCVSLCVASDGGDTPGVMSNNSQSQDTRDAGILQSILDNGDYDISSEDQTALQTIITSMRKDTSHL